MPDPVTNFGRIRDGLTRVFFVDSGFGERLDALLNPSAFPETVQAIWAKQPVLGLSHEVLQYVRTVTMQTQIQLYISKFEMDERGMTMSPLEFRNFFLGLIYPFGRRDKPSDVTFVWPNVTIIKCVVENLQFNYTQFAKDGSPLIYTIDMTLIERRQTLREYSDARLDGFGSPTGSAGARRTGLTFTPSSDSLGEGLI
jgi:hypothetical protein